MTYIDLIFGVILIAAFVFGLIKGLVRQIFSLAALFLGVYCAFKFSGFVGSYISGWLNTNEIWISSVAFLITFILVLIGVVLIGKLAERFVSFAALGFFNRLFGGIFGMAKIILIACVVLFVAESLNSKYPLFSSDKLEASLCYKPLKTIENFIFPYLHW